ncbi:AAR003Wp [Eremothecium gossypii ATCC 10895]|uniref:AAR003Wp n=1 Tax=Eremothecium gossypii (strain ATCC 10895 / CBS 109.51 / FGSC 9923 / NRRL Y-1056) TaxID=284811 RepID=Q75ES6_EREGS|nr:AAR003Wp [Eremothecium gossypii ATCC 10895]AAS50368.1 AAR003Wp [Eremothecium gossypii ATCC 10895]AEY94654.1 FAAR003Wp [Eremothecium gossypii FDAG1]
MNQDAKKQRMLPSYRVSTFTSAPRHPLGVKPSGNAIMEGFGPKERAEARGKLLGHLAIFPEELLVEVLTYITTPEDLRNLGHASRMLYAYTYDEELWRKMYTNEFIRMEQAARADSKPVVLKPYGCDQWKGSWRKTILKLGDDQEACLQVRDTLYSDLLYRPYQCSQVDYKTIFRKVIDFERRSSNLVCNLNPDFGIDRFDESQFDEEKFRKEYIDKPFILRAKDNDARWPGWDLAYLVSKYPQVKFRQESVTWPLSHYADYFKKNRDESPLYLFDCASEAMEKIKNQYAPPDVFQKDFFTLFQQDGVQCRPDHRWLIAGPARSGSTFHKDPNQTSAWNAVLSGMKLWVMLPPDVAPPGVSTDKEEEEVTSPVGITEWVLSGYYNDAVNLAQQGKCRIGVQFASECIYVPAGWWHTVINITDSVALTENFVPEPILPRVLNFFKNKTKQISGFHMKDLVASIESFLELQRGNIGNKTNLTLLEEFLDQSKTSQLDNEDCGVLNASEIAAPLYEFFCELIQQSDYRGALPAAQQALKDIEIRDAQQQQTSRVNIKDSEKWMELTKMSESPFSFCFDADDDA